jgi:hypothetical protein
MARGADGVHGARRLRRHDSRTNANAIVDEAIDAGLDGSDPLTVQVKMLRAELLP